MSTLPNLQKLMRTLIRQETPAECAEWKKLIRQHRNDAEQQKDQSQ